MNFSVSQADKAKEILTSNNIMDSDRSEALAYALIEIADGMNKIYRDIIPELLSGKNADEIKEKLWDLREEFRHVQYHIDDAKLRDL